MTAMERAVLQSIDKVVDVEETSVENDLAASILAAQYRRAFKKPVWFIVMDSTNFQPMRTFF